jgi:hypothetical protein
LVLDDTGVGEKNLKPEAPPLGDGMVAEADGGVVAAGTVEVSLVGVGVVIICCTKPKSKPELDVGAGLASAGAGAVCGTAAAAADAETPPIIISPSVLSEGVKNEKVLTAAAAAAGEAAS